MSVTPEPAHLSNHHRNTLRQIFEHPVSHNIEWRAVVSLLDAVGTTVEQPGGKLDVTIGSQKEFIEPPSGKDLDTQTVLDLRRMLGSAGYGPDGPGSVLASPAAGTGPACRSGGSAADLLAHGGGDLVRPVDDAVRLPGLGDHLQAGPLV